LATLPPAWLPALKPAGRSERENFAARQQKDPGVCGGGLRRVRLDRMLSPVANSSASE